MANENVGDHSTEREKQDTHFLLVDDDVIFNETLARSIRRQGYSVATATNSADAITSAKQMTANYVVLDLKIGDETGLDLIKPLIELNSACKILILTGYSSISTAVTAIKMGAADYLCKPVRTSEILTALLDNQSSVAAEETEQKDAPSIKRLEWEHIQRVLQEQEGNISAAARILGMHRRTLQRKLQKRPVKK